ncbi:MAG: hypothetical protein J0H96_05645 [Microbacterium ginsengisoli]|nr:hypothetical protein [Microbacterium ginsengisoli]
MGSGYSTPAQGELGALIRELQSIQRRLDELETPTGTSVNSLVAQVQQAIANITATVTAAIDLNSYTKAEIDAKVASPGAITPTSVTASGDVTASGNVSVGGQLLDPDAVSFVITGGRYATWIETATGRFGNTSSSRRYKQDITPAEIDADTFLSIVPFVFHYIAEVRKRDDPTFEGYVGPDYVVALEYGLMAEDLHAAGLTPWVYYDAAGQPDSVNYTMLVVPLLAVARAERDARAALEARVSDLETLMKGRS